MAQPAILERDSVLPSSKTDAAIDVNTSSADALRKRVPKVGNVLAQRIVEFREVNGPFRTADDLMKVPGIGRRLAESLFPLAEGSGVMPAGNTLAPPWGSPAAQARPDAPEDGSFTNDGQTGEPLRCVLSSEPAAAPPAPVAPTTRPRGARIVAMLLAMAAGLCVGVWANAQTIKGPARELGERIEATRAEQERARTEMDARGGELHATQEAVRRLQERVERESAERKAEHERVARDVAAVHESVRKSSASTEARIQRLRDTLTEIELYHGANLAHPAPQKGR